MVWMVWLQIGNGSFSSIKLKYGSHLIYSFRGKKEVKWTMVPLPFGVQQDQQYATKVQGVRDDETETEMQQGSKGSEEE